MYITIVQRVRIKYKGSLTTTTFGKSTRIDGRNIVDITS